MHQHTLPHTNRICRFNTDTHPTHLGLHDQFHLYQHPFCQPSAMARPPFPRPTRPLWLMVQTNKHPTAPTLVPSYPLTTRTHSIPPSWPMAPGPVLTTISLHSVKALTDRDSLLHASNQLESVWSPLRITKMILLVQWLLKLSTWQVKDIALVSNTSWTF